jgi:hypothetical protein
MRRKIFKPDLEIAEQASLVVVDKNRRGEVMCMALTRTMPS